jgi:hypothetical protein
LIGTLGVQVAPSGDEAARISLLPLSAMNAVHKFFAIALPLFCRE